MEPIIKVENLGKKYILDHKVKYGSLRETIAGATKALVKENKIQPEYQKKEEFWALKNVAFEVQKGERIGVIGRNGAGKSTLLKILSRITEPTVGKAIIDGRVSSLLEVGTGFHPELTGRENIFLNGAILGMRKKEIEAKFDEIVAFSEVERFLDTPVKRYSSGMYVKLAFAVAAHLEPDILIIDEVLAVGDIAFQKKCLGKMEEVSGYGRTVLFVSHNLSAIRAICPRVILLNQGETQDIGPTDRVLPLYYGLTQSKKVKGIEVISRVISTSGEWEIGTDIEIQVSWDKNLYAPGWHCDIACYTLDGAKIFALESHRFKNFDSNDATYNGVKFTIKNMGFNSNDIRVDIGLKKSASEPYFIVLENCLILSPSNKNMPEYKREDVIIIPQSQCQAIRT